MTERETIEVVLIEHKIFPNKKGFGYLKFLLEKRILGYYGKLSHLYSEAAKNFGVKPNTIEKSISNAIEGSFKFIDIADRYGVEVCFNKGKITNKKFVDILFEQIHNRKQ